MDKLGGGVGTGGSGTAVGNGGTKNGGMFVAVVDPGVDVLACIDGCGGSVA